MDYTYLYFFPKTIQQQKLKVVILFSHDSFKLEVLLAGYNRDTQAKYWKIFKEKVSTNIPSPIHPQSQTALLIPP